MVAGYCSQTDGGNSTPVADEETVLFDKLVNKRHNVGACGQGLQLSLPLRVMLTLGHSASRITKFVVAFQISVQSQGESMTIVKPISASKETTHIAFMVRAAACSYKQTGETHRFLPCFRPISISYNQVAL